MLCLFISHNNSFRPVPATLPVHLPQQSSIQCRFIPRKPSTTFAPPPSLLRNQHLRPPKTASASASAALATAAPVVAAEPAPAPSFQSAFVAVQSTVLQEHDPARPNDYEDYHKDKLRQTKKAKLCKELEWPAASERSPPAPPADQGRLNLSVQPSSTSTDTPPLMTDVIHTQGKPSKECHYFETTFKMSRKTFDYLCSLIKGDFTRKTQSFRNFRFGDKVILGVEDQVAVALLRLTTGESLLSIGTRFGMNHSAISNITWKFIECLEERATCHLKWPDPEEMATIKAKFEKNQGLPNCCGAIDTTHILMCSSAQPNSNVWLDSENKNSMVLQTVVDPDMRFRDVVSGWPGSLDDSCILRTSGFYRLCQKTSRLTGQMELPGESARSMVREYIVGDPSYPLLPWLMTPYQEHCLSSEKLEFNKRQAATRMVVQGALANLKERWQVLKGELWRPDKHRLPRIIYACCLLTNIMIDLEDAV